MESYVAVDEEIPTVDYSLLFSDDHEKQSIALQQLSKACDDYGFFYLVNHTVADEVIEGALKGIVDFFELAGEEEKKKYWQRNPTGHELIMWNTNYHSGENREYLKMITHPNFNCPSSPAGFREALEEYLRRFEDIKMGLARAISKNLGLEENYIETKLNLKTGFNVAAMNMYPPNRESKGNVGVPCHTDPGFIVSLIQNVDGGLQILSHNGKLINVRIPPFAILIQLGDHLEVLTNGKYKSHYHHVVVKNNEVRRISLATLHGPSLETFVAPAPAFVKGGLCPAAYGGMTYEESLKYFGHDVIEVVSCLEQVRVATS